MCATRGEAGESRVRTDDLAALREAELRSAAGILGVGVVGLLDYADSGMSGDPQPGTLAAADPSRVAADVRSVIDDLAPDLQHEFLAVDRLRLVRGTDTLMQ